MRSDRALNVPLLRFLGASLTDGPGGFYRVRLKRSPNSDNAVNALHGGAIATVLDVAAYLAVLPQLTAAEEAITVAFSAAYLSAADAGVRLCATGGFIRRSRHLAFATAELRNGDRLLALATITKAIRSSA